MLIYYYAGRMGVEQARDGSRSALPDAPMVPERHPRTAVFRIRAAGALHRLADRVDTRADCAPLQRV